MLLFYTPTSGGDPIEASIWGDGPVGHKFVVPLDGGPRRIIAVRSGLNRIAGTWDWHEVPMPANLLPRPRTLPRPSIRRIVQSTDEAEWEQPELDVGVTS